MLTSLTCFFYDCMCSTGIALMGNSGCFPCGNSHTTHPTAHAGCFSVSIIHWTLTWRTSLTSAHILMHAIVHRHIQTDVRESECTESGLWKKNPLPQQGLKPASVVCQSNALPSELHPHPICSDCALFFCFWKPTNCCIQGDWGS